MDFALTNWRFWISNCMCVISLSICYWLFMRSFALRVCVCVNVCVCERESHSCSAVCVCVCVCVRQRESQLQRCVCVWERERERESHSCSAVCVCARVWERESYSCSAVCVCVWGRHGHTTAQTHTSFITESVTQLCSPLGLELMVKLRTLLTVFTLVLKAKACDYARVTFTTRACGVHVNIFCIHIYSVFILLRRGQSVVNWPYARLLPGCRSRLSHVQSSVLCCERSVLCLLSLHNPFTIWRSFICLRGPKVHVYSGNGINSSEPMSK